jgi:phosphoserine phosphatase RsbU/P
VRIASSGLPYPLHFQAATSRCRPLEISGLPLGSFERSEYEETTVALAPGDVLVFHTDGVTDARRGGEDYGLARLIRQVEEHAGRAAPKLGDRILADVHLFLGDRTPADDVTLVVVKVL